MPRLRDLGEFEALRRLVRGLGDPPGVVVGPGDDAAVLRPEPGRDLVATTDVFLEGRHWLPEWMTPREVGARLALANLSDLAAMAATARWALVAIAAPSDHEADALVELERGIEETLAALGGGVVGGNLSATTSGSWVALTVLGEVERGRAWTRNGARPGDTVAVTGHPGRAGAAVRLVRERGAAARDPMWRELLDAWIRPASRVGFARALAATGVVSSAIDVSDGLTADLDHLCEASGVGAALEAWGPRDPALERAAAALGVEVEALHAAVSDDYELLITFDPEQRAACEAVAREQDVPFTVIGSCTDAPGILTVRGEPIEPGGYDHFRG